MRFTFWNCVPRSFVRHRGGKSNKKPGKRNPTRSSSLLVKKLVAGRDVPYLLCRCRVAINWAEFTAVEKRHTANIIHRTRPVIWCRFATENRIPRRDSRKISREPNEFPQFDSFSQKHLPKNSFVRVDFPTHRKEYRSSGSESCVLSHVRRI